MPQSALLLSQRAGAVITHAETLQASLKLLEEAQKSGQPRDVINKLGKRVLESIEQIDDTLEPIARQIKTVLATNQ